MAAQGGAEEDVYLTLLMNDTYLPGALVLGHSLRDGGTSKKLGALVTLDTVAAEAITQLKASFRNANKHGMYDYIIPVPRIKNPKPSNLSLMNRTDLHSAFTKINLWKQTSFRKIVYLDADIVAYRAPDELFDIAQPFSAAPDIGWPDLFNTGVMVLKPNPGDYYALMAMAERGISFDGADQGLLNMHFKNNCNRISFSYNVTPSAHYQYVPAYRHFQSSINMVHFIGSDKPWFQGRYATTGSGVFDEMTGRWWAVYDRHYRAETPESDPSRPSVLFVQYLTKGEYQPRQLQGLENAPTTSEPNSDQSQHEEPAAAQPPEHDLHFSSSTFDSTSKEPEAEARKEHGEDKAPPPPPSHSQNGTLNDTKPEAANFPATIYEMSRDTAPFVPPERYPSPPRNMYYEVPKERPARHYVKPKAIFPWEINQEPPTRVFAEDAFHKEAGSPIEPTSEPPASSSSEEQQTPAETCVTETSPTRPSHEPATPTTPTISVTSSDPWSSFTRTNAWDEVPEIERYVGTLQKHRRSLSLKSPGIIGIPSRSGEALESERAQRGLKLTDFPSEAERPSLPVTPAPIRRPKFWGGGGGPGVHDDDDDDDDETLLPAAEGVPEQSDWVCVHGRRYEPADCLCDLANVLRYHKDPAAQLQKLAKQQSEMLLQKLGSSGGGGGRRDSSDMPPRPVPFGSEELTSPTYVPQTARVLSPQPVKGHSTSSMVRGIVSEEQAIPEPLRPSHLLHNHLLSYPNQATLVLEQVSRKARTYIITKQLSPKRGRAGCTTDLKAASSVA
ncbi:glycogenin glucosyltransferase [Apiospora hydei]|uniref:Glycogenin glucosyltransferase n=1 Tax=Apiospora hydei TaxID=1337664 RepID=A0ABR1V372_9PEZI